MSEVFAAVVERLLSGKVVCRYSDSEQFAYLDEPLNFAKVRDYLASLHLSLRQTRAEDGYLLTHARLDTRRAKAESRAVFQDVVDHLRPLVIWLAIARKARVDATPLVAGEIVREADLLSAVTESPELARDLEELCRLKPFQSDAVQAKRRLSRVLEKLVEMEYLQVKGHSKTTYLATAKFSVLYDLMDFIRDHEQLQLDEGDETQLELLQ